jgi:hypothetical protein
MSVRERDGEVVYTTISLMKLYRNLSLSVGFVMGLGAGYALAVITS